MIDAKATALSFLYQKHSESRDKLLKASSSVYLMTWQRLFYSVLRNLQLS